MARRTRSEHRRVPSAEAPWVRTRLRAAPGAALALAGVVLVTAFLAAAMPRTVSAYETSALRDSIARVALPLRSVSLTETLTPSQAPLHGPEFVSPAAVDTVRGDFARIAEPTLPLHSSVAQTAFGVRNTLPDPVTDTDLPELYPNLPPRAELFAQQGVASQARLTEGSWARATAPDAASTQAVVTDRTARVMHLHAGSAVHTLDAADRRVTVRITGVVAPRDPSDPFWRSEDALVTPERLALPMPGNAPPHYYWEFGLLADPDSAGRILTLPAGAELYWHWPVDTSALNADGTAAILRELLSLGTGPDLVRLQNVTREPVVLDQQLDTLLTSYRTEVTATDPVLMTAGVGTAAAAAIVLLMVAGLAAERRREEFALLRSRGASARGLAGRLLGETAVVALPAAALGTALALLAIPATLWLPSVLLGAAVGAVATLALPVRAVAARRGAPSGADRREGMATTRPSRRRTVAELTLLVLVAGSVAALRARGASDGSDLLVAGAPALLALAGALLLIRLSPPPLRLLARSASRLAGAVAHLGLARAGRSPVTAQLPLLALLVAISTASVGGSVLAGVTAGRDSAAMAETGADARIDAAGMLPAGFAGRLRGQVGGIRETVPVRVESGLTTIGQAIPYSLVEVDPASYQRLVRQTGVGVFPAGALSGKARGGVLPAVVSPALARQFGSHSFEVDPEAGPTRVRIAAVTAVMPAAPPTPQGGSDFVMVSTAALRASQRLARAEELAPTSLFVMGSGLDGARLRAAVAKDAPNASVTLLSQVRAGFGTPLQSEVREVYLAAAVTGAAYGVLALLLALLRAAPQRAALLARLRTMGMTRRQFRLLAVLEMAPQAVLCAVGGVLVSLAALALLGPDVSLQVLAFGADQSLWPAGPDLVLRADPLWLAAPAVAAPVLVYAVLWAQVWWAGRRRESTRLRIGDRG